MTSVDPVGAELSVDTFTITVFYDDGDPVIFAPLGTSGILSSDGAILGATSNIMRSISYGMPLEYTYNNNTVRYYMESVHRIGTNQYKLKAMSAIGFLDKQQHLGGIYDGTTTFADLVAELIGDAFPYTISGNIGAEKVRGWLPVGTARENLHRLLFAFGVSITRDADWGFVFSYLTDSISSDVPASRIFIGGTVNYETPKTYLELTEHSFYQRDTDPEVLFDNGADVVADHVLVTFNEPYFNITASNGLTINESGANYAIVSGIGQLTGKKYAHDTRIVKRGTPNPNSTDSTVTVTDDTLVNPQNSTLVANRVYSYYANRKRVIASLVMDAEKSGDMIGFINTYGSRDTGIVASMDIVYSSFAKARCEIDTGFTPGEYGNTYNAYTIIEQGQTWMVANAGNILVVAIGGGDGGEGGASGQTATGNDDGDEGGVGGIHGAAGAPGKVFAKEFAVNPGDSVTAFVVGRGGTGGAGGVASESADDEPTPGAAGNAGASTIAFVTRSSVAYRLSSDSGASPSVGYLNFITGEQYAMPGEDGVDGGKGNGASGNGAPVEEWDPGDNPSSMSMDWYWPSARTFHLRATSGYGSGAAYGSDGADGERWSDSLGVVVPGQDTYDTPTMPSPIAGDGADGATPVGYTAPAPGIGFGGSGGHGGGGGGCGGAYWINNIKSTFETGGKGGRGGTGSAGQTGGNGAVIVYFRGT